MNSVILCEGSTDYFLIAILYAGGLSIGDKDPYDKAMIESCSQFVDCIDPEKRYLKSRRYVTKAKFDTYFSIRTPVEQYAERQNILKNVRWEQYNNIQEAFQKLGEL